MERFEFYSRATLTKRASDDCNPLLAVIVNLPIVVTDGVFEGKKRQGIRTTEPRHSARQQHALGVLVPPVLNLVSYHRMSALIRADGNSLKSALLCLAWWCEFNLPILH